MKLSIIVPVYNEEKTILEVLEKLDSLYMPSIAKEVIVVDDGSKDSTTEKLKRIKNKKIIFHKKNKGKGAAVITGIKNATGDYIIIQDADLEYDPKYIVKLMEPVKSGKASIVYGTRLKRKPNFSKEERTFQFLIHYLGNRFLSLITSALYGQWITDMETGYKLFPKNALKRVRFNARGFEFEPEITAKLMKRGYKILEIPIKAEPRGYNEGKKLNTVKDGTKAFWYLFKYRFTD